MKVELDIEGPVLQAVSLRLALENRTLSEVVNAWLKRASRQERTVMPGVDQPRAKVVKIGGDR